LTRSGFHNCLYSILAATSDFLKTIRYASAVLKDMRLESRFTILQRRLFYRTESMPLGFIVHIQRRIIL